jgi:hypothetical protein
VRKEGSSSKRVGSSLMPYDACTPSRRIRVPSKFSTLGHQVCRWLAKELVAFLYPVKASDQSNGTGSRYIEMNEQHCSSHSQKENQGGGWHLGTMPLCFVLSGRHSLSRSVTWYALDRRMTRAHACAIVGDGLLSGSHAPALTCCHISVARRLRLSIEGDALIPAASRSVAAGAAAPRKCRVSPTRVGPC